MSDTKNNFPLGTLLQNAGLISYEQLQSALEIKSQYDKINLGDILVIQESIKAKTIDFFVDKWQSIQQEGQQFPIGYYLKLAGLLEDYQIETILRQQQNSQLKFGDIAVKQGWIKHQTISFFLNSLSFRAPDLITLNSLEKYNQEELHLELKYADPSLILSRVLAWTGGNFILTKAICHIFAESDFNIPAGSEMSAVDRLVEGTLIRNWQTTNIGAYIRVVKGNLVNNHRCDSTLLLKEYQEILLSNSREYKQTKEQEELLILGLIVNEQDQLRVTNIIYQQIFNQDWVVQELSKLPAKSETEALTAVNLNQNSTGDRATLASVNDNSDNSIENIENIESIEKSIEKTTENQLTEVDTPEPITKMSSLMTLAGIILLIPLILAVNNYYSLSKQKSRLNSQSLVESKELTQFCNDINLADPGSSSLNLIYQLEKSKKELLTDFSSQLETFPDNCKIALNQLRVLTAPQLGKESRVLEAIKNLCRVPADSDSFNEAKVWLDRWYESPAWGQQTKSYLNLISSCPAEDK